MPTISDRRNMFLQDAAALPLYNNRSQDEIVGNILDVISSNDTDRQFRLFSDMQKYMPKYENRSTWDVKTNVFDLFSPSAEQIPQGYTPPEPTAQSLEQATQNVEDVGPIAPTGIDAISGAERKRYGIVPPGSYAPQEKNRNIVKESIEDIDLGLTDLTAGLVDYYANYTWAPADDSEAEKFGDESGVKSALREYNMSIDTFRNKEGKIDYDKFSEALKFSGLGNRLTDQASIDLRKYVNMKKEIEERPGREEFYSKVAENIRESVPESVRKRSEEATQYVTNLKNWKVSNIPAIAKSALTVTLNQAANIGSSITPVVGLPAMIGQEGGNWSKQAKEMGLVDKDLIAEGMNVYAVPSGIIEYTMNNILAAPFKAALTIKPLAKVGKKVAQNLAKTVLTKSAGKVAKIVGAALGEGAEEYSQDMLSDAVLYYYMQKQARRAFEQGDTQKGADTLNAMRKINLDPFAKKRIDQAIVGTIVGLTTGGAGQVTQSVSEYATGQGATAAIQEQTEEKQVEPIQEAPVEATPQETSVIPETPETGQKRAEVIPEAPEISPKPTETMTTTETTPEAQPDEIGVDMAAIEELANDKELSDEQATQKIQIEAQKEAPVETVTKPEFEDKGFDEITYEEFKTLPQEKQQEIYESNPVTGKPGQRAFTRVFKEKTNGNATEKPVAMFDLNGFSEYNNKLTQAITDKINKKVYEIISPIIGAENTFNLHGDEYTAIGESVEDLQGKIKLAAEELAKKENWILWPDGVKRPITFKALIGKAATFEEAGKINPKNLKSNQIGIDKSIQSKYNIITGAEGIDENLIVRRGMIDENSIRQQRDEAAQEGASKEGPEGGAVRGEVRGAEWETGKGEQEKVKVPAAEKKPAPKGNYELWQERVSKFDIIKSAPTSRDIQMSDEYNALDAAKKRKSIVDTRKKIRQELKGAITSSTKHKLENLYEELGRMLRKGELAPLARANTAKRKEAEALKYAENDTKSRVREKLQDDTEYTLKNQDLTNKDLREALENRYTEKAIENARKAIIDGKKDGKAANEIRYQIAKALLDRVQPNDIIEEMQQWRNPKIAPDEAEELKTGWGFEGEKDVAPPQKKYPQEDEGIFFEPGGKYGKKLPKKIIIEQQNLFPIKKGTDSPESFGFTPEDIKTHQGSVDNAKKTHKEVAKQMDMFEQQTDLFDYEPTRRNLPTRSNKIPKPDRISRGKYPGVPGKWEKHKRIDFVGQIVRGYKDLAQLWQAYRHARLEHMHIVYVDKNGKILAHNAISSGIANFTYAIEYPSGKSGKARSFYRMNERMKRLGAVGYYIIHNHPSGTMRPSHADLVLTNSYNKLVPGFKGHIIIDSDKYVFINPRLETAVKDLPKPGTAYNENLPTINSYSDVAQIANEVIGKHENKSTVLILNNQNQVVSVVPVYSKSQTKAKYIYDQLRKDGGLYAIAVTSDMDTYTDFLINHNKAVVDNPKYAKLLDIAKIEKSSILSAHKSGTIWRAKEIAKYPPPGRGQFMYEPEPELYSEIEAVEKAARSLRGKLLHVSNDLLGERAKIQVEIDKYKESSREMVMNAIYDYAKKIGLRGEPYNRVDTLLKNTKTAKGLQKAVDIMDGVMQQRVRSKLRTALIDRLRKEQRRIKLIESGKRKSTISLDANRKIKNYIDSFTMMSEEKADRLNKSMNWFMQNPEKEIPHHIRKGYEDAMKENIRDMTNDRITQILEHIKYMKSHEGKLKYEIMEERRKRELDLAAVGATKEIIPGTKEKEPKSKLESALNPDEKARRKTIVGIAKNFGWGHLRPETIIEKMANWKKGVFKENTFNKILEGEINKLVNTKKSLDAFKEIHKDIDVNKAYKTPLLEYEYKAENGKMRKIQISIAHGMFIYANSKNPGNRAHLIGTGVSGEIINDVEAALPEKYKDAVDKMIEYFDGVLYGRMNEVFTRQWLIDLPKEAFYFPIQNIDSAIAENPILADMIARKSALRASVKTGSTKSRIGSAAPFKKMDYFGTVVNHILNTEHYIAYNQAVREVDRFLNHPELKRAMMDKSEEATSQIKGWLRAVAYGSSLTENNPINNVSDFLRTNYVTSVLGFNVVTMMKQPASFSQGIADIEKKYVAEAVLKYMKNIAGEIKAKDGSITKFVFDLSPMMANRSTSFERELVEMAEKSGAKGILGTESWIKKLKEKSMAPIQTADMITTSILWYAKFQEQIESGASEKAAIAAADENIRKTQPMGGIVHLPEIYRGGGVARAYTMFTNQLNQNLNRVYELADRWGETKTPENAQKVFFYAILPSMILYAASNGLKAPWKDPEGWAKVAITNITGGLMFINKLVEYYADVAGNKIRVSRGGKKRIVRKADLAPPPLSALYKLMIDGSKGGVENVIEASTQLTGIPYTQLKRTSKGIVRAKKDITEGTTVEKILSWRNLIWSEYALKDKSIAQDVAEMAATKSKANRLKVAKYVSKLNPKQRKQFFENVKKIRMQKAKNKLKNK